MNRRYYRGAPKDGRYKSKWIYGYLVEDCFGKCYIYSQLKTTIGGFQVIEVIPETLGQHTGMISDILISNLIPDVFEGDVIRYIDYTQNFGEGVEAFGVVMWIKQLSAFYLIPAKYYHIVKNDDITKDKKFDWLFEEASISDFSIDSRLTKIGDAYNNPEYIITK